MLTRPISPRLLILLCGRRAVYGDFAHGETRAQLTAGGVSARLFIVGAVAQLGARLDGIQEVTGSTPVSSTSYLIS